MSKRATGHNWGMQDILDRGNKSKQQQEAKKYVYTCLDACKFKAPDQEALKPLNHGIRIKPQRVGLRPQGDLHDQLDVDLNPPPSRMLAASRGCRKWVGPFCNVHWWKARVDISCWCSTSHKRHTFDISLACIFCDTWVAQISSIDHFK